MFSNSPASSSRASSPRTVDGPQGISSSSAIHFEPNGLVKLDVCLDQLAQHELATVISTLLLWRPPPRNHEVWSSASALRIIIRLPPCSASVATVTRPSPSSISPRR